MYHSVTCATKNDRHNHPFLKSGIYKRPHLKKGQKLFNKLNYTVLDHSFYTRQIRPLIHYSYHTENVAPSCLSITAHACKKASISRRENWYSSGLLSQRSGECWGSRTIIYTADGQTGRNGKGDVFQAEICCLPKLLKHTPAGSPSK